MCPTVHREGPFRYFFYSNEGTEPPHVHIEGPDGSAKVWISTGQLASHMGLRPSELATITHTVRQHQTQFLEAWHEHFGPKG